MTTTKGLRMITEETVASNEWLYDEMICLTSAQQEYKETHTTLLFHEWLLQSIEQYPRDIRGLVCTNDTTLTVLSTLLQSSKMRNLETVFFSLGRLIDDNPDFIDQLPILSSFTHLKTLKINKTTNLNIPLLNKMLPYLNKLEDLNLFDNNIDSQDLVSIIETIGKTNCPDLKSFTIIGNELGKEGVIALVENFADRNLLLRLPPIALENLKLLNECKDGITTLIMYNIPSVEDIQNALPSITSVLGFKIQHSKIHCLQYAPTDLTNPQASPKILDVFHPGIQIDSTQIVGEVHHFKADEEHVSYDY